MKATDVISDLRVALAQVKKQGSGQIQIADLESYLVAIEKMATETEEIDTKNEEWRREHARMSFQSDVEAYKHKNSFAIEMLRAVLETGQTALRSAVVINGGAAAALLAFMGNILTKAQSDNKIAVSEIGVSLLVFVIGLGCAGVSFGFRYLSQAAYAENFQAQLNGNKQRERLFLKAGNILRLITIFLGIAAFVLFFYGGVKTYLSFMIK